VPKQREKVEKKIPDTTAALIFSKEAQIPPHDIGKAFDKWGPTASPDAGFGIPLRTNLPRGEAKIADLGAFYK